MFALYRQFCGELKINLVLEKKPQEFGPKLNKMAKTSTHLVAKASSSAKERLSMEAMHFS